MEQIPARIRQEDAIAGVTAWMWIRLGESEKALDVLNRVPRDYIEEFYQDWPKDYVTGWAMEIAGRKAAAQAAWAEALRVVEKRLGAQPNRPILLRYQGMLLALTGRKVEAEKTWKLFRELIGFPPWSGSVADAEFYVALGQNEEAIARLQRRVVDGNPPEAFAGLLPRWDLSVLRHYPTLAPIRDDPRVQQIIQVGLAALGALRAQASRAGREVGAQATDGANVKSAPADKSVAVLAFANLSDDKENEYFSDGISEELLNVLAKVPGLRVAARTSAFYFKGKNATAQEIGQKLGVAHLVDGSVRKAGTKVRIAARLSKADTGEQLWGESYEDELKDIFALQDRIASDIAGKLQVALRGGAVIGGRPVNPEAYRLLLEGRHFLGLRDYAGFDRAEAAFARAVSFDQDFPQARAGLGDVWLLRGLWKAGDGALDVSSDFQRARTEGQAALARDATMVEAQATLGYVFLLEGKLAEAQRGFERVVATNPNYASGRLWNAVVQLQQGRLDAGHREVEAALILDPLSFHVVTFAGEVLGLQHRFSDALAALERAAALRQDMHVWNEGQRSIALWMTGQREAAVAGARRIRHSWPQMPRLNGDAQAVWILMQAGHEAEASDYAAEMLNKLPAQSYQRGFMLGAIGRFADALPYLERVPEMPIRALYWSVLWDRYRADPRFLELTARLGRAQEYKIAREMLARMHHQREAKK